MENFDKKIDELTKVVSKLIRLVLELGTLVTVIKMVLDRIN